MHEHCGSSQCSLKCSTNQILSLKRPFFILTIFVHADIDTLGEPAGAALVPVRLVNHAGAGAARLARVPSVSAHGPLEESRAAVAGEHTVVLTRGVVATHGAWHVVEDTTCRDINLSINLIITRQPTCWLSASFLLRHSSCHGHVLINLMHF